MTNKKGLIKRYKELVDETMELQLKGLDEQDWNLKALSKEKRQIRELAIKDGWFEELKSEVQNRWRG